jgi:hypothetical protein
VKKLVGREMFVGKSIHWIVRKNPTGSHPCCALRAWHGVEIGYGHSIPGRSVLLIEDLFKTMI